MKTGVQGQSKSKLPVCRNRALEAGYYTEQQAKTAALLAKKQTPHGNRASEARRNEIAELIRQNLPQPEIMRRTKATSNLVEDVRADMLLGKHGGFK